VGKKKVLLPKNMVLGTVGGAPATTSTIDYIGTKAVSRMIGVQKKVMVNSNQGLPKPTQR